MKRTNKGFRFQPFSLKQKRLIYWWKEESPHKGNKIAIADGAVRSGKTIAMLCGFFLWSLERFHGEAFILAGKTIGALKKNVVQPGLQILTAWGVPYHYVSSGDEARIEVGGNVYYMYDAHNERSQDRLQGLTAAGALLDEVALMPKSFVDQAMARCSVAGSKLWFNCNPENPAHFVKTELIDKAKEKKIYHLHFTMDDNLSLDPETRAWYETAFTGVFHKRFVEGCWARTEGLVYPEFANDPTGYTTNEIPAIWYATIGVDFGGTGSAHSFTLTGFTVGYEKVVILDEYYHDNRKKGTLSPKQVEEAFVAFVARAKKRYKVYEAYCDSAEQTLIQGLRIAAIRAGTGIEVKNAHKGPINDRIMFTNSMIAQGRLLIHGACVNTAKALQEAVYDSGRLPEEVRLDDGTTNIDSLDSMEYSMESKMQEILYLGLRR